MTPETRDAARPLAAALDIPLAHLLAIIEVESDGRVFHEMKGQRFPYILFEPHRLYRLTEGAVRDRLVVERLASRVWNKKLYPKSQEARWSQIKRASDIAGPIAYEAVSYGVGQVLGQHWRSLGFDTLQAFLDRMFGSVEGQIEIMLLYIERNGLLDELRDGRWAAFFRGYNGPAWKKNGYDRKVDVALLEFGGARAKPDGMLRLGAKGARVRELQALVVRAGYEVKVDGDFGPSTKKALQAFQQAHGLKADGVYGPETEKALGEFRQSADDKPGHQKVTDIGGVLRGAGTAIGGVITADKIDEAKTAVEDAIPQLQQYEAVSQWVGYGVTALTVVAGVLAVAGIVYAGWSWLQSTRTVET